MSAALPLEARLRRSALLVAAARGQWTTMVHDADAEVLGIMSHQPGIGPYKKHARAGLPKPVPRPPVLAVATAAEAFATLQVLPPIEVVRRMQVHCGSAAQQQGGCGALFKACEEGPAGLRAVIEAGGAVAAVRAMEDVGMDDADVQLQACLVLLTLAAEGEAGQRAVREATRDGRVLQQADRDFPEHADIPELAKAALGFLG